MTPTAIEIGGLTLVVGMLAFAQRLGGWEHKPLARGLNIAAGALFVAWCFLFLPSWCGWTAAAVVWSTCLWFVFAWVRKSVDKTREITRLNQELFNARAQLADAKTELQRRDVAQAEEGSKQEEIIAKDVPQLLIQYIRPTTGEHRISGEDLLFINDGEKAIVNPKLGPLTWKEQRPIVLIAEVGTLPIGAKEAKGMWLMEAEHCSTELFHFMQERIRGVVASVTATYEDTQKRMFSREFFFTAQIDETIICKPGPVKPMLTTPAP